MSVRYMLPKKHPFQLPPQRRRKKLQTEREMYEWKCINKNSIQILDFASWRWMRKWYERAWNAFSAPPRTLYWKSFRKSFILVIQDSLYGGGLSDKFSPTTAGGNFAVQESLMMLLIIYNKDKLLSPRALSLVFLAHCVYTQQIIWNRTKFLSSALPCKRAWVESRILFPF